MKGKGIWFILAIGVLGVVALIVTLSRPAKPETPTIQLPEIAKLLPNSTVSFEKTKLVNHYKRRWDESWSYEYRAVYLSKTPIDKLKTGLEKQLENVMWRRVYPPSGKTPKSPKPSSVTWMESYRSHRFEAEPKSAWTKSWMATVTLIPGKKAFSIDGELPSEGKTMEIADSGDSGVTTVGVVIKFNLSKFTPPPPWKMAINSTLRKIGLPSIP